MNDGAIPAYLKRLDLPGLADIHVHFLPENMLQKVWAYFDGAGSADRYGREWPIQYRFDEDRRLELCRTFGMKAIPALTYPHKPGMAEFLNIWCAEFAQRVPDAVHCGTLYPEDDVERYVRQALNRGAWLFKMHVQVGKFAPDDEALNPAWAQLEEAGAPVVIHAGSAPVPGEYTGSERVRNVLRRYPKLTLVIAHLGMGEYDAFADLAEEFANVHLDTTMAGTDFTEQTSPMPDHYIWRLAALGDKVVLGSDFPNIPYPYAHQLEALDRLGLGDEWLRKVLWENGKRLMRLPDVTDITN